MAISYKTARLTLVVATLVQPFVALLYYRIFHVILFMGLFSYLLLGGGKKIRFMFSQPFVAVCFLLFLYPFVTIFWSNDPEATFYRSVAVSMHIPIFLLTLAVVFQDPKKQPYVIVTSYLVAFIVVCIYIYIQYGGLRPDSYAMKLAIGSFSNVASAAALCSIPFFISSKNRVVPLVVNYLLLFSCLLIILLSQSRSALGLSIIAICLSVTVIPDRNVNRYIKAMLVLFLVSLTILYIASTGFANQFVSGTLERLLNSQLLGGSSIFEAIVNPDESGDDYTRTLMYHYGWEMIRSDWLTGSGFGTLKGIMEEAVGRGTISHNWIITSLGELGVIGFLSMLYVMIYSLFSTYKLSRRKRLPLELRVFSAQVFIGLALLFLQGMTRPLYTNPMFSLFLGFSVWLVFCSRGRRNESEHE